MKRWIWPLLLCLLLACDHTVPTPASSALPTGLQNDASDVSTAAPIAGDEFLRTRTVTLALPNAAETVSFWRLGIRMDAAGNPIVSERALFDYARSFSMAYEIEPMDAQLVETGSFDAPYTFTEAIPGVRPDAERLYTLLKSLDYSLRSQTVVVPTEPISPVVSMQDLQETHALLATYTTSFSGSTLSKANRVHNIVLAASRINGCTVQPDEVFSINKVIGDRIKANGYKLAGAIANGMNTTEYGGGVCQVSTTLFNAVLMADLAVEERYHHSWPMAYAPVGRDATIATGQKDFRFRNTTDTPITIFATVDEKAKTVSVSLYGRHSDAFDHIEIVSEQLSRLPSKPAELHLDESLPPNTKEVEREGRRGRTSVTYLDYYDAEGVLIRRITAFEDTYPSISEIAYVSPDLYHR